MTWIATAANWLLNSRIAQWVLGALALFGVIKFRDRQKKREGRDEQNAEQLATDAEKAAYIQRRVAESERVPLDDDDARGYRD